MTRSLGLTTKPIRFWLTGISVVIALATASTVFTSKKAAEHDARAIRELNVKIAAERQRISELRAEWSALDHPARLQRLVDRHNGVLKLKPVRPEQITNGAVLPQVVARAAMRGEEEESR